jgi:hypothetical protein
MTDNEQRSEYRQQIYNQMKALDTAELLRIWKENKRGEYTDEAFDVIRELLQERLGEVPEQGVKSDDEFAFDDPKIARHIDIEQWEKVALWLKTASWVVAIYGVVAILFSQGFALYHSLQTSLDMWSFISFFLGLVGNLVSYGFVVLVLRGLSEILFMLGDILTITLPAEEEVE